MVNEPVGIIGAGIVGLATARQLAAAGVPVTVWEKEPDVAGVAATASMAIAEQIVAQLSST